VRPFVVVLDMRVAAAPPRMAVGRPRELTSPLGLLMLLLLRSPTRTQAKIWLGTPPMGWEDFDSHTNAGYNESYARKVAGVQARQLLPSGYDTFIIGGWSMGGQVLPNGTIPHYANTSKQYTLLDEFGRPLPDGARFPSAVVGGGGGSANDCACDPRNCSIPRSTDCTDPVCVCKAGSRSLRPFAAHLNSLGLRLGLWTWRGVHRMAAVHKLKVSRQQGQRVAARLRTAACGYLCIYVCGCR
jgi:hypothetical protein